MSYINKYLRNFKPYKLASHKVWVVDQEHRNKILKLDWNEATIEPSPKVKESIIEFLNMNEFFHLYPATYDAELHQLLSNYVELPKENIQYFGSSDSAHEYISKMFINVGDPVLIVGPSYDNFRLTAEVNGARVYFFEYEDDFSFNKAKFESKIDEITPSLVYICNPNNPTGYLHTKEYIEYLLKNYSEVMFLIDEAYYEFSEVTVADLTISYENLLITRTMSKAFALANFRFGYMIASRNNISYISSIRNPKNITTFAQIAAKAALKDLDYMYSYVRDVNESKKYFLNEMKNCYNILKAYSSKGNFVMIKCHDFQCKMALLSYLENNEVFIRDLSQSRSVKNCARISMGTLEEMEKVVLLIKKFAVNEGNEGYESSGI
ncbi:MAG: histidinol-phosphate aminotransferase family protein [Lachnospiraceae bacterium]|nr:histidinol-phosphate aminotransferase family protein [Lachnospiraceae bacterium]